MYIKIRCQYYVILVLLYWSQTASAVMLPPGMSSTSGQFSGVIPKPGKALDSLTYEFVLRDNQDPSILLATGRVDSRVVREDSTELLRFEYQLFVDADSPGNVDFLVMSSFGNFDTDVDYVLGGTGDIAPDAANRGGVNFDVIAFFMNRFASGNNVSPGESSLPVFIQTNATHYDTNGLIRVQQGLHTEDFTNAFQPTLESQQVDSSELFFQKTINFNSNWTAFEIPAIQTLPLIGYGPSSFNGTQPGVIRIRPIDAVNGQWQIRFQEYQYLDQYHLLERVNIMGFTEGVTTLDNESMIVTGLISVSGNDIWKKIDFPVSFAGEPRLFLFAQSAIGGQPPTLHARNVNESSFEVAIKEEEQLKSSGHVPEDIAYFAIYSPANQGTLMINNQQVDFSLQQIQVNHQWISVPDTSMEIKLEEEQSLDQETRHLMETVDVMIVGDQLYTQAVTTNGADTFTIRKR